MKQTIQEQAGQRLDLVVINLLPSLSRASARKLCDQGRVLVNGRPAKPAQKFRVNDTVTVDYDPDEQSQIPDLDLPIIYEDDDCVVINKPAGVLTHSKGAFNPEPTVATWLQKKYYATETLFPRITLGNRQGIVHRLDRATSGVMICAKNETAHKWLQKQFSQRKVKKSYSALIAGSIDPPHAIIDMPIERNPKHPQVFRVGAGGKAAVTEYNVTARSDDYSLLELKPTTGRTHQLRVHLCYFKHPIVGDTLYGGQPADRLYLHADQLELTLPNRQRQTFRAPLPKEFKQKLRSYT